MAERSNDARQRISLDLTRELVSHLDHLRREWGIRSRGDVLERLLDDLFGSGEEEDDDDSSGASGPGGFEGDAQEELDEQGALVLVGRGALETLQAEFEWRSAAGGSAPSAKGWRDRSARFRAPSLRRDQAQPAATHGGAGGSSAPAAAGR